MRFSVLSLILLSYFPLTIPGQLLQPPRNFFPDEDEDEPTEVDQENEETNSTGKSSQDFIFNYIVLNYFKKNMNRFECYKFYLFPDIYSGICHCHRRKFY